MKNLTPRQERLLELIAHSTGRGRSPQVGELIREMGLSQGPGRWSSLTALLKPLERKGYIRTSGGVRGQERVIELTPLGEFATGQNGLPLVGAIPAGPLSEVLSQSDKFVKGLGDLLPFKKGDFLLEVQGDSMINDGIMPGDKVLLRPGVQVYSGEVAAVHVGQEYYATLKHVIWGEPGTRTVTLRAANPQYADVTVEADDMKVAGVYRGLIRTHNYGQTS